MPPNILRISDTQDTTYTFNGTLNEGGKAWYQAALEGVTHEMRKLDDLTRIITDSMNETAAGAVEINCRSGQESVQKAKYPATLCRGILIFYLISLDKSDYQLSCLIT